MARPKASGEPAREPVHLKLTDQFVRAVKPEPERVLYHDSVQPGFVLVVEPTAYRSFKLVYRFGDRPRWLSIARADAIGLAEARKIARRQMAAVVMGTDPQAEKVAARRAGTFAELAESYIERHAKRRNRSWAQTDFLVRKYLLPTWANRKARDIDRAAVRAVFNRLTDDGVPMLANYVVAQASAIFSWAIRNEVVALAANPCHGVERNPTQSRERVLSEAEVPIFWKAFDELDLMRGRALRMILLTGQRPGEVRHMRREHLDVGRHSFTDANGRTFEAEGAWWTLPGAPDPKVGWPGCKNGASHRCWLPQAAVAILDELGEGSTGFVFTGARGRPVGELDDPMRNICERVGVSKDNRATPHDLRRTHGTLTTSLGFSREQMNRIQNHKEGGIASVYDRHSYANENRQIMEAVCTRIMALVEGGRGAKVVPLKRRTRP